MSMLRTLFSSRLGRLGLKLLIVAAVVGFIGYRWLLAPVPVRSAAVVKTQIVAEVMGTGTLEARVRASISPRISGRLTAVNVDQGDRVKQGQLLATLDDGELRQQVEVAKAELSAARAGVDRAAADISKANATGVQARLTYDRLAKLHESNAVGQDEFDNATERRDVADAEIRRAEASKLELERQVAKAEESLRYYQERFADTKLLAPFDGLVVRRLRDSGDVLVPGGSILDIVSTEHIWVSAWVDESEIVKLAVGQPARIVFRAEADKSYPGTVTRLGQETDRETRELLVDVTATELPRQWAVGQRAEVYIETTRKSDATVIPSNMIVWRDSQAGVILDAGGEAKWQAVTVGVRGVQMIEVLKGLDIGQRVITPVDPLAALRDGRAITVR